MASDAAPDSSSDGGSDQVSQGADRIRDTAKWLVAGFGALGSALIASLQFSDLGQVTGHSHFWALFGFGLGIGGVLVAMLFAASVLAAVRVSLPEITNKKYLREYLDKNVDLYGGYLTFDDLCSTYREYAQARIQSYSTLLARKYAPANAEQAGRVSESENTLNRSKAELGLVNPVVSQVLGAAIFEKLRHRWVWCALPGIVAGVVLAAVGASVFASNIQATGNSGSTSSASTPSEALIRLTASGQQRLGSELGTQCSATDIQVLVLDEYSSSWKFEAISDDCNPAPFNANDDDVIVEAELQPCPLPSSTQSNAKLSSPGTGPAAPIEVC